MAEEVRLGWLRPGTDLVSAAQQMVGRPKGDLYRCCVLGLAVSPSEEEIGAATDAAVETFLRAFGTEADRKAA